MTTYKNIEIANGKPISQQGVCGVFAVALVTNLPVQRVFNKIRKINLFSKRWKGSTNYLDLESALDFYKRKYSEVNLDKKVRLSTFVKDYTAKNYSYIVWVNRHVYVVHDKNIYDQMGHYNIDNLKVTEQDVYYDTNKHGDEVKRYIPFRTTNKLVNKAYKILNTKIKLERVE
mgnify:CR=1 FL=1|jgi:hypothetical protein